jgi:hypothetical protein
MEQTASSMHGGITCPRKSTQILLKHSMGMAQDEQKQGLNIVESPQCALGN